MGLPAIIYDLKCSGSQAYIALAKEFLERGIMVSNKKLGKGLSSLLGDKLNLNLENKKKMGCF